jgi:glutamine amidotransferase
MITIVDYGVGNLVSVKKAFEFLGENCEITSDSAKVWAASKIVLPGVGHFASTDLLRQSGLRYGIAAAVVQGAPFLGICVGMQWMLEGSEESPHALGLSLLRGKCSKFPSTVKSPHVGWNSIDIHPSSRLFKDIPQESFVYFTHSFRAPVTANTVACCEYGGKFSAAVERDHMFGVQFHPEKSGETGLQLLKNFCAI